MQTVRLGKTEARVPRVSVGTWGHGGPKTVGRHPVGWSGHDAAAARAALLRAWDEGLTHWDTADVYGDGQAERLIGSVWQSVDRSRIFLASKVGWDPGPYGHFYHPQQISQQLERSLQNLQTDYLDLYYLHHCDFGPDDIYLDDAIEVLRRLRADGKIRHIGLSDWSSSRIVRVAERVDPDVVQPYRNVMDDEYEASGLESWVEAHDVGVAFFSPLKHGLLLGHYREPVEFGPGDHRNRIPDFRDQRLLDHLRRCRAAVCERYSEHPHPMLHALIGALLGDQPSACALLGLRRPEHAAAAATAGEPLSPDEAAWVRGLYRSR
jgi:aryl-alcohol dehydrogenase-like predicted oxidoreductase